MQVRNDFLWGGATAANPYEGVYNEGGKGLRLAIRRNPSFGIKRSSPPMAKTQAKIKKVVDLSVHHLPFAI